MKSHSLLLNCRAAARLQSEGLDHPLSTGKKIGLWLHLLICKWCRRYGRQIRFLRDAAQEQPDALATTAKLSDAARDRIKQRLNREK
jgi:hypothetical protein